LALQLQAIGKEVPAVIVLDTLAPGYPRPKKFLRRIGSHLSHFVRPQGRTRREYLAERFDHMKKRVLYGLNLHWLYAPALPGVKVIPQETIRKVWGALYKAREIYRPDRRYNGKVVLVSSENTIEWVGHEYDDPNKGWHRWVTGSVQLYMTPAPHIDFFKDEYIELLASQYREVLRQVATETRLPG
jgi:thioesterase domain-containing protein